MKAVLPDDLREIFSEARHESRNSGSWHKYLKAGDWLVLLVSGALVVFSYALLWRGGVADRAIVKRDGKTVIELSLNSARKARVEGPLGTTVIEVQPGRARVFSDPGPRQYCVQQGWLTRAGAVAICAPNHLTLQLNGRNADNADYDSLNY
ncbi:NusG domain II-containing protein [Rugosibacter aromaticivorans]|uniref:NusG domain II-containing protein n=1 Tax=Rugosibacter aromaticivorans TaxID=1565605 RepID=UPI000A57ACFA|nr:NusG domain II-containing protein [Rugosibacter aromaticivorans]